MPRVTAELCPRAAALSGLAGLSCALGLLSGCGGRTHADEKQAPEPPLAKADPGPKQNTPTKTPPAVTAPPPVPVPIEPEPPEIEPEPPTMPPPLCAGDSPFGAPALVPGIHPSWNIDGAWLSEDGLELLVGAQLSTAAGGDFELRATWRNSRELPFEKLELIMALSTPALERKPVLTPDGLTVFFESDRSGDTSDIYVAERASLDDQFGEARVVVELSTPRNDAPGAMSAGNTLYFTAVRIGGEGNENLFRAARKPDGSFSERFLISSVDSDGSNVAPAVSSDERTLFFSSNRDNPKELNHDIYRAHRPEKDQLFALPEPVPELNSSGSDIVAWVSLDECTLLFTRELVPGSGHFQLFMAQR